MRSHGTKRHNHPDELHPTLFVIIPGLLLLLPSRLSALSLALHLCVEPLMIDVTSIPLNRTIVMNTLSTWILSTGRSVPSFV